MGGLGALSRPARRRRSLDLGSVRRDLVSNNGEVPPWQSAYSPGLLLFSPISSAVAQHPPGTCPAGSSAAKVQTSSAHTYIVVYQNAHFPH